MAPKEKDELRVLLRRKEKMDRGKVKPIGIISQMEMYALYNGQYYGILFRCNEILGKRIFI